MRERPILMTTESVKAILDGRKTQTRRVVKDPRRPSRERDAFLSMSPSRPDIGDIERDLKLSKNIKPNFPCPYGQVGDSLWVRETWAKVYDDWPPENDNSSHVIEYKADTGNKYPGYWPEEYKDDEACGRWRPSIFMPRWASRLTLEIIGLRVERLQDIIQSDDDMRAEGIPLITYDNNRTDWGEMAMKFQCLWNSLNAKRGYGWETNPWVWVITFGAFGVRMK